MSQPHASQRRAVGIGQATKPLPRLPRGWSRVCHETGTFLRSIGLEIVVSVFQGFFRTGFREPEKAAIRQSRIAALLRSLIHAVPLGMAIFEIVLNWKGRYHGASFNGQSFLQFFAKAHEIFMQASIATIILSYTRHHMSISTGMPFGAILGSLQFLQVSYLWSVEFFSAIMSKDFQLRKKMCFIGLILLCVTIAATAGPSSATLLLARQGPWPRKPTYLAVNATSQELWPNRLDGDRISSGCKILSTEDRPHCPTIRQTPEFVTNKCQRVIEMSSDGTLDDPEAASVFSIRSLASHAVTTITFNHCGTSSPDQVCSTSPQSWIADQFVNGTLNSFDTPEATDALDFYRLITRNYYQPYTVTSCVADTFQNDSDQAPLRFARISLTVDEVKKAREIVPVRSLTKSQLVNSIPGNVSQVRVGWIDLPQGIFATGTPGAVIVYPQSSSNSSYNIATCTFSAGWGSSEMAMGSNSLNLVISTMTNYPSSLEHVGPGDTVGHIPWTTPIFVNDSRFSYPQLPVSISKSWMEFVNPSIILPDNSTIDIAGLSLSSRPSLPSESETAALFSYLLTAALGDTGMGFTSKVFDERMEVSTFCKDCLVLEMEALDYGWIYTAQDTATKLAITVMLGYCVLVIGHILYSTISGVSSTAWDSTAELVALAMNSSPTEILQNTCAGIIGRTAFATNVRVLKVGEKHLELVFGELKDPDADISKFVLNEKYGRIAGGKGDDLKTERPGGMRRRALTA